MTDPIADMLTRIRNANQARHKKVMVPASNLKRNIADLLYREGYISGYKLIEDSKQGMLEIFLKFTGENIPVISGLKKISTPGLKIYSESAKIKRVENGLGVAVVSTNRGIMTDREARLNNLGGEILFHVW